MTLTHPLLIFSLVPSACLGRQSISFSKYGFHYYSRGLGSFQWIQYLDVTSQPLEVKLEQVGHIIWSVLTFPKTEASYARKQEIAQTVMEYTRRT